MKRQWVKHLVFSIKSCGSKNKIKYFIQILNVKCLNLMLLYFKVKRSMLTCQTQHYHSIISKSLRDIRQEDVIKMFDSYNVHSGENSQTMIAVS